MGVYKTESRTLRPPVKRRWFVNQTKNNNWVSSENLFGTTQSTTSYRTFGGPLPVDDPLSQENRDLFTDVAGNGFRGEYNSTVNRDRYDNGHDFYTTKTFVRFSHGSWKRWWPQVQNPGYYAGYWGPLIVNAADNVPGVTLPSYPLATKLDSNEINFYGARAIASVAPTQPGFSLTTFLGELLKEGVPALFGADTWKERNSFLRDTGGEYLNLIFGWKTLVNEVQSAARQLQNATQVIRQFERDRGRHVRRKLTFPVIVDNNNVRQLGPSAPNGLYPSVQNANFYDAFASQYGGKDPGPRFLETSRRQTYRFSGCFQYAVIEGKTFSDKLEAFEQKANILLGTRLTPEVLWNLAPWSWLIDWKLNIGDVLANATYLSTDGLVMRYGYLMRHTVTYNRYTIPDGATFQGGAKTGPIVTLLGRETKERVRATPYGFALNPAGFSAGQWAILGALGLTKAPNTLP